MNEEKALTGIFIISSDPSQNYNVSSDFDTDLFYEKLNLYMQSPINYDYFFVIRKYFVYYTVCEKQQYDDILQFAAGEKNGADENSAGLIATYPYRTVPLSLEEGNLEMTDIADLLEKPTDPLPSIHELYDICVKLMSEGSSETTDNEQNSDDLQLYEGEDYQEYADIAVDFIDKYEDMCNIIDYGTSYDENDEINFKVIPTEEEVHQELESNPAYVSDYQKAYNALLEYYASSHAGRYNRNTDERFNDIDDIKEYALSIISEDYFNKVFADSLTDKLAGAKDGDTVTSDKCTFFTMYDGKLYVQNRIPAKGNLFDHWTNTPIKIYDVTETSFIAEREWSMFNPEYEAAITDPEELESGHMLNIYIFRKDPLTGEWRIDKPYFRKDPLTGEWRIDKP